MAQDTELLTGHFERRRLADALVTPSGTVGQKRLGDLLVPGSGTGGLPVGTGPGTVAAGDDGRIVAAQTAAQVAASAQGIANAAVAGEAALRAAADATLTAAAAAAQATANAAYPSSNPAGFIPASGAPVQSVAGRTGAVTLGVADVSGAYASSNPAGFVTAAGAAAAAPLQSVAGLTGTPTVAQLAAALGGTTAGTLANGGTVASQGASIAANTAAIAARLVASANLSDLAAPVTARSNLGLGGAATLGVGTASGTVAAGDDSRITGALPASTAATTYAPLANPSLVGSARVLAGSTSAPALSGAAFQISGGDANNVLDVLDSFGGSPSKIFRRANGTATAPSALAAGDVIADVQARGFGATAWSALSRAWMRVFAGAAWTDASQPTAIAWATTPLGSAAPLERLRVQPSGNLTVGTTADDGINLLQVAGATATNDLNVAGTGGVAGAWTSAAAAVSATSGALTTAAAVVRSKKIARLVFCEVKVTVTTNGTGAGLVQVALPYAAAVESILMGRGFVNTSKALSGVITASGGTVLIANYDGTYPALDGATLVVSGLYEAAA